MKIVLSDGTEIKDLTLNASTLVSQKEVSSGSLEGKLDRVTYVYDDGSEEVKHNMCIDNIANYGDGWHICLREKPEAERLSDQMMVLASSQAQMVDDETAEKIVDLFPEWDGNGRAYAVDFRVKYDGNLYRCVQAHTSQQDWTPAAAASLWSKTHDPAEEFPAWIQPTGGHDAYAKGAKVSHSGKHWTSDVDANVWEPGAYGWTEV